MSITRRMPRPLWAACQAQRNGSPSQYAKRSAAVSTRGVDTGQLLPGSAAGGASVGGNGLRRLIGGHRVAWLGGWPAAKGIVPGPPNQADQPDGLEGCGQQFHLAVFLAPL